MAKIEIVWNRIKVLHHVKLFSFSCAVFLASVIARAGSDPAQVNSQVHLVHPFQAMILRATDFSPVIFYPDHGRVRMEYRPIWPRFMYSVGVLGELMRGVGHTLTDVLHRAASEFPGPNYGHLHSPYYAYHSQHPSPKAIQHETNYPQHNHHPNMPNHYQHNNYHRNPHYEQDFHHQRQHHNRHPEYPQQYHSEIEHHQPYYSHSEAPIVESYDPAASQTRSQQAQQAQPRMSQFPASQISSSHILMRFATSTEAPLSTTMLTLPSTSTTLSPTTTIPNKQNLFDALRNAIAASTPEQKKVLETI